jgi:histidyl-tRNA synthetase
MSKAVEAVANRNPAMVERLMRSMFGAANPTKLDFVYDAHTAALMSRVFSGGSFQSSKSAVLMSRAWNKPAESLLFQRMWQQHIELRMTVQDRIRVVFNRHRAVQFDAPLLMPRPVRPLATLSTAFPLLDARGNIVILPVSDMVAFARHCAHQGLCNVKRFSCSKTYRRGDDNQQPRESQECNYDAVLEASSSPAEVAFAMAETFAIVREIIAELAPLLLGDDVSPRRFCIRFNHLALLDAFIDAVLLTIDADSARELPRLRAEVYSELAKSWRKGAFQWPQMRSALSKRFSESGLDALVTMLQNLLEKPVSSSAAVTSPHHGTHHSNKTSRWASRVAMENFSRQHENAPSVRSALQQIHHTLECMHALGFTDDQIVFDPRLILAPECFASNLVFNVTLCSAQSTTESMPRKSHARAKSMSAFQETASRSLAHNSDIVIAEGGRYDALLSRFRLPESVFAKSLGVGFSMSIDRLVQLIHDRHVIGATQKSSNAPPTTHRATSVFGPFPPALSLAAASDSASQRALSQSSSALAQRAGRLDGRGGVLLIGAPDHDSMHDRLAIAAQLWKEDIRAGSYSFVCNPMI